MKVYEIYNQLCSKVDLIIGNENDYYDCLGIKYEVNIVDNNLKDSRVFKYREVAKEAFKNFKKLKYSAISIRTSLSASENKWQCILAVRHSGEVNFYISKEYLINDIVDRIGTGDSFAAGIIYGLNKFQKDYQKTVDFATALSCLNHTITGDACEFKESHVMKFLKDEGLGRIAR